MLHGREPWSGSAVVGLFLAIQLISLTGCSHDQDSRNLPPTLTAPLTQAVVQGETVDFTAQGVDPNPGSTLTYAALGKPENASFNTSTGAFSWMPTYEQLGIHVLLFTVSDGVFTTKMTTTFTVLPNTTTDPDTHLTGGSLSPLLIPKYVTPLVIPPVMKTTGTANDYAIAARQFRQQILPGGIWNRFDGRADAFPATIVWGYGPTADPVPDSTALGGGPGIAPAANSQFNYPAYTIETIADVPVKVRWSNELVDATGKFLPPLLTVDQTLHWANPPQECVGGSRTTDCVGINPAPYIGPVPIVTHLHGAHVAGHSDGYPEAWWLPAASNIPAGYARSGRLFDDSSGSNPGNFGFANFLYRNDQPATNLWYHDHALGLTRSNVYAGLAGFWLVRGSHTPTGGGKAVVDAVDDFTTGTANDGRLPGPAPLAVNGILALNSPGDPLRNTIREIPILIQDRSFNADGTLFYPTHRSYFEGLESAADLQINLAPDSDIAPLWNPESFFNTMVVNGTTWPKLDVAPARYRFRLLNGCNSRFLNLALLVVDPVTGRTKSIELPFFIIGSDQGALPQVVKVKTGFATLLPGNGTLPAETAAPDPDQALLMGPSERFDVIVDFSGLADGTVVRMINTAPDAPFGGFDGAEGEPAVSDPLTTGQIMQFVVKAGLSGTSPTDPGGATPATPPQNLVLNPAAGIGAATITRQLSLNEEVSSQVCAATSIFGTVFQLNVPPAASSDPVAGAAFLAACAAAGGEPFAPKAAKLGTVDLLTDPLAPAGIPLGWTDDSGVSIPVAVTLTTGATRNVLVTEMPVLDSTEEWEIYNFTVDAHPIHLHLVRFAVISRTLTDGTLSPHGSVQPWETGFKDMVIAYPGEVTRVRAKFDLAGLYVWHCHILEHEDNEMMRPFVVVPGL